MGMRNTSLTAMLAFAAGLAPARAADFTVIDLGTLPGGTRSYAYAISNDGEIVGISTNAPDEVRAPAPEHAVLWTKGERKILDLHPPGFFSSRASAINDHGQVLVTAFNPGQKTFIWTREGGFTEVAPAGFRIQDASSINEPAQVAGSAVADGTFQYRAALWSRAGGLRMLEPSSGIWGSLAYAINQHGQIAGTVSFIGPGPYDTTIHAFLWTSQGGRQDLGTLGGRNSIATAINEQGEVAGYSDAAAPLTTHAFLWTPQAGLRDLGELGTANTYAKGINGRREVVGYAIPSVRNPNGPGGPFLWTEERGMQPLPSLPGTANSGEPSAINDEGQIAGAAPNASGALHAVLWIRND